MCGRYTLSRGDRIVEVVPNVTMKVDIREQLGGLFQGRWNIAPSQDILVVANREGELAPEPMRWGLVPSWSKDVSVGNMMINARSETAVEKPVFRKCLERRRCVIPADGFYEWRKHADGKAKTPMFIHMKDGHAFGFAGLWETWQDPADGVVNSCTILTTSPNELMAGIHNRMPVILPREGVLDWLDAQPRNAMDMVVWLKAYPAEEMEAWPVSRLVNSAKNQGAELTARVAESEEKTKEEGPPKSRRRRDDPGQGSLF